MKFCEQIVRWVEEWLRDRTSVVTVNGLVSPGFAVTLGVPQGSVLGPLLFLIYINDLPKDIVDTECRLYADDTLLCMDISELGPLALRQNIDALGMWSNTWGMRFNPSKCVHMAIGKNKHPDCSLTLNGALIPKSSHIKYLGVTISTERITDVGKRANSTLGMLRRCLMAPTLRQVCWPIILLSDQL